MSAGRLTRIAPTPSGFLHLGNAVNFTLISQLASRWGANLALRIDDMDSARARPEYIDDIFATLDWLEIPWTIGPRDRDEFARDYSMSLRTEYYREQLDLLRESGLEVFACSCSRAELAATGGMRCAGRCLDSRLELEKDRTALRLRIPEGTSVVMGDTSIDLAAVHGDVVLWRRDGLPSYHLVTVVEDRDGGVTDIVRGIDLLESSALHRWLAPNLDAPNLAEANFVHHALITDESGAKLSKSQAAPDMRERTSPLLELVRSRAAELLPSS